MPCLNSRFDLAVRHHRSGQLQEAEQLYRQILSQQPKHINALQNLGLIAHQTGRNDVAVDLIRRAIALNPNYAEAHSNLGNVLKDTGQLDEAIAAYRQAIALNPNLLGAYSNLGNALADKGQIDEAVAVYRQSIALNPNFPKAHNNLGTALKEKGQLDEAIAAYRQAIILDPHYTEAHSNLGNALKDKGDVDEAIAAHRQAIVLNPSFSEAHNNLGMALKDMGQLDEALAAYRQAVALRSNFPEAHYNVASVLLAQGDFQPGWEEYEWRWKLKDFQPFLRNFARPLWDGSPLESRTLLLHAEQGFGDAIQFIRYLPFFIQQGGKIIVECQIELQRLFQTVADGVQVVARGHPLPAFDLHCPLLSLPRIFGTTLDTIPNAVPYLQSDPHDAENCRREFRDHEPITKVGLAWAGNPAHKDDHNRSMQLATLAPLVHIPGVRFFSLQKGEWGNPRTGLEIIDWTKEPKDFADTAALIANLDLVIAVDTAVAHLAGAMGKPVWTLLPFVPDWRWLLDREDSPWYPSMRLFRQPSREDWDSVVAQVVDALSHWQAGVPKGI